MIYTTIPARRAYYDSVVAFPEGAALSAVVQSEVLKPFEGTAFGSVEVFLQGTGTTPNAHTMVSFDGGAEWHELSVDNFANGFSALGSLAAFAPRVRVDVDLNGATITDADDWKVSVLMSEEMPTVARKLTADLMSEVEMGDDETLVSDVVELTEGTPEAVYAVVTGDNTEITLGTLQLETSFDGVNWWGLSDDTNISAADVTFIENNAVTIGKYVRATLTTGETTGAITEEAKLRVHLLSFVQ